MTFPTTFVPPSPPEYLNHKPGACVCDCGSNAFLPLWEQTLLLYTPSYIHSTVPSLWNFPQDIGCQDPPLWPSLHERLFIAAWLISGNTRSHLHLFYWWALLGWPQLACLLHNRTLHVCVCVQTCGNGRYCFSSLRQKNITYLCVCLMHHLWCEM